MIRQSGAGEANRPWSGSRVLVCQGGSLHSTINKQPYSKCMVPYNVQILDWSDPLSCFVNKQAITLHCLHWLTQTSQHTNKLAVGRCSPPARLATLLLPVAACSAPDDPSPPEAARTVTFELVLVTPLATTGVQLNAPRDPSSC